MAFLKFSYVSKTTNKIILKQNSLFSLIMLNNLVRGFKVLVIKTKNFVVPETITELNQKYFLNSKTIN